MMYNLNMYVDLSIAILRQPRYLFEHNAISLCTHVKLMSPPFHYRSKLLAEKYLFALLTFQILKCSLILVGYYINILFLRKTNKRV